MWEATENQLFPEVCTVPPGATFPPILNLCHRSVQVCVFLTPHCCDWITTPLSSFNCLFFVFVFKLKRFFPFECDAIYLTSLRPPLIAFQVSSPQLLTIVAYRLEPFSPLAFSTNCITSRYLNSPFPVNVTLHHSRQTLGWPYPVFSQNKSLEITDVIGPLSDPAIHVSVSVTTSH